MKKNKTSRFDFLNNTLNKYSIRKFTVGTASILIGSLMFLGTDVDAATTTTTPTTGQATTDSSTTADPTTTTTPTTDTTTTEASSTVAPATTENVTPSVDTTTTETAATTATPEKAQKLVFNADNTELTGVATAGLTVELHLADGTIEKTVVNPDGTFTFKNLTVASEEVVSVITVDGEVKSDPVGVTANKIVTPTTEAPTTEASATTAPTSTTDSATTEAPTKAPVTTAPTSTTDSTTSVPVLPDTATTETVASTVNDISADTPETKKATLVNYLTQNTGVTVEIANQTLDALNLDYNNLTSDELMAALLNAIATNQDANTVVATPATATSTAYTNEESIALDLNDTVRNLTAPSGAGDSILVIDGKNVIESAAFNSTTQHTVNGKVVQQWTGNPLEINNPAVATPLAGVRIYAQWVEKSGDTSPIYTTVSMADGTYHILMQDFVKADGTIAKFDADPNLPAGEKFRVWAETPTGLQLFYSWENGQLGPQSFAMDTSYNASNAIAVDQLNNFNFIYVPQTDESTMHNLADAAPTQAVPGETGFISGTVFWNNNINVGAQTMGATASNSGGTTDTAATNVTVVGSYLSDYALQQIYTKAAAAIGTSNIRGIGWTDANEQALQNWIKQQIALEGTDLWIGETVTTTTDATGKYTLQFNGTYGKEWNDRGFNGLLLDSALNSTTRLPDAIATSEGLPIGSTYADLFNHVASSPQIGTWYGDTSAGVNAMTIDAAPKHVNLDWTYVSLLNMDSYGLASPYYGNKFLFDNASTSWTNTLKVDAVADQYITGADFALFLDQMNFDVVKYDTNTTPATRGTTVTTNTVGLPSPELGNNLYQIVWYDKNGVEVAASPVQSPTTAGTIPSSDFVVPMTALDGDVYTAKIFAIEPADGVTRSAFPLASDSFVVSVTDATVNEPNYIDTTLAAGTSTIIAAPLNSDGSAPPVGTTYAPADTTTLPTWVTVNADGTISVNPDVTVPAGSTTVPVTVTYPDGSVDTIDVIITVTDATAPVISPIADITVPAGTAMTPVTITVDDPTATTTVSGLPAGVTYDPATGVISGTPTTPGTYPVTVTSVDAAGNTSTKTFTYTVTDTNAPVISPIADVTTPEDVPMTPITVVVDDPTATTTVSGLPTGVTYDPATGVISGTPVDPGVYPITVTSVDAAGNSTTTFTITVTDTTAPDAPTVNPVTSEDTAVTGIGVPGNTITVTFPDGSTGTAVVQPDGTWSVPAGVDLVGGEVLPVTSTDPAGNVSPTTSVTVSDVTPPPAPPINPVTSEDTVVTGTGEPGGTVTVKFPDGSTATAVVQPDGTWSAPIPAGVDLVGGEVLTATEADATGNVSPASTVTVTDTTAPDAPTVNPVTSEDTAVTGIGVPGNTITVTFPDGSTGTAVVQPDGTWSVPVPVGVDLVGGEVLPVTSTDPAGNVSPTTNVTVSDVTPPPAPPVNPVTSEDTVVTGTGVPGDTITVKFPDGSTGTAVVQPDGTWSVPIPAGIDLVGGEVLPVTETDPAGNVSPASTVTVTDTTAPNVPTVNPVTSEDSNVTGIGTPGNTITVTFPDGSTGTAVVQPDGTWSVPVPAGVDLVGGEVLPVTSTDPAGNVSPTTNVTVSDVTPPPAPPVNPVTSEDTVVTGTGVPGDTITVKFPDGSTGTAVVQPDGTWSVVIPAGVDLKGGEVLPVVETDPAGNVSPASSVTVTDTTAPLAPPINTVSSTSTTVTGVGEPGNTVTVTFPDGSTSTAVVQPNGTWSAPIPAGVTLADGEIITATQTDPAGNVSPASSTTVTDVTPPSPAVNPVTSEDTVITGTGTPGDTITVTFPNGSTATTTVQPDGTWTVTIPAGVDLVGGEVLPVTETDPAGNSGSTAVTVTDKTAPNVPTVNPVTSEDPNVTGIGVPGNTITVTFPDGSTGTAVVQPDGTWSVPVPAGVDLVGGEVLPVTSTDPAGNVSPTTSVTVSDVTPPAAPPVNPVTSEDTVVTGTGVAGDTITVKFPDGSTGTAVVQPDGTWTVTIPTGVDLVGGEVLPVTETDPAGNVSPASSVTVTDTTAPNLPTVNPVTSEDAAVTGIGTPGNTITVTFPDGSTGTAVVQPDGTWSVPVPTGVDLVGGEVLPVTSTDPVGNVSPPATVTVKDVTPPPAPPFNPVTSEDTVVTGTGEPGGTVTVKFPDGSTSTAVVQLDGTWSAPIPAGIDLVGGEVLTATEADAAGNVSPASSVTVTDTTAPNVPTVNPVTSEDAAVIGIGTPGNTITVTFPDGSTGTAIVQPDGTWSVPVPAGVDLVGGEVLPVTSTDPAGNVSPTTNVTVSDVTPPPAPPVNPVTSEDTVVTGTGVPGDTITVKFPDGSTGTAVVQPDGTWSVTIPAGVDLVGGEVLPVTETDPAGNVSPATSVTVTDTTSPTIEPIADVTTPKDQPMAPIIVVVNDPTATTTVTGLPAGVTYDSTTGVISGTPTQTGSYPVAVTTTDAAGNTTTETFIITVIDTTAPVITTIADVTTPEDQPMTPITVTVDDPTATTTVSGLPNGVTYDPATGQITGTPTDPGTYPVTVTSVDPEGNTSSTTFTITVTDATAPVITPINDVTTPEDQPMTPITVVVNDPTTTTVVTGLPAGVTFDPASGVISGTPTEPGTYPITVTTTDPAGNTTTQTFVITVTDHTAPAITPIADVTTPEDKVMIPIDVITDDKAATIAVTGLPTGVTYDPALGAVVGTPVDKGVYPVTVTATDAAGNVSTTTFVITVTDQTAPVITPIADVVTPEDVAITPITVVVDDPTATTTLTNLPAGLTYDPATGVISGVPTLPGSYDVLVTSTDPAGNSSTEVFNITVTDVTSAHILPIADVTTPEDEPMAPITVVLDDPTASATVTGLPAGVTYDPISGIISGTPTDPGVYPVTVTSMDSSGNTETEIFTITVTDKVAPVITPINDLTTPEDQPMAPITVTVDDPAATTTVSGLPNGVTYDPATGVISGTPTEPGTYPVTVTSVDTLGNTSTETFIITVTDATAPVITPINDVTTPEDQPMTPIAVTVNDPTATTTVIGLPIGVTYDPTTGQIAGTPTEPGTYPVTVTSVDPNGNTTTETFNIIVTDTTAPAITPINDVTTPENQPMTPITVTVNDPTATTTVTGLPAGVTYDPTTGIISGTPTEPGTYPVTVTSTDKAGNVSTETFIITVTDVTPPVISPITDVTTPEDQPMVPIKVTVNDKAAITTVTGLPAGVTYDPATGIISGVPTTPGTYPVTVTSVDPSGNTTTETFNIIVTDVTTSMIEPISDVTTPKDQPILPITVVVNDPTAATTVTGLPAGVTYDPATGIISGTPTEPGIYPVTVTVVDTNGNTETEIFTITVTDNTAPVIASINDVTTPEDQPMTPIAVTVDDKSAITTVTGLPVGVTYDPTTGLISGTPTEPGTYTVTVTSVDQYGNTTTVNFVITVTDVTAPIITPAISDVTTPEDQPMVPITVTVNDPTATTTITGLPAGVTYDPTTGIISGTPTEPGTYPIVVVAKDAAGNTSSETFVITVTDTTAPVITPITDVTTPEDQPLAPIKVKVDDPTATTTVTGLPTGVTYDPTTGIISGTPTAPGTYPVTVTSVDKAGNTTTETFVITVTKTPVTPTPDTTAPVITPITDVTTPEDQPMTPITVKVDDPTATTTVTGLPTGVTYDPTTGIISGTPTTPGTYPVTVTSVDKAGNTTTETFVITVTKTPVTPTPDTTAPVIDVAPIHPGDTEVTGTSEPGSTVTVTLPNGTKVTTDTKDDGTWLVTVPAIKAGETVSAVSEDKAGNVSDPSTETAQVTPIPGDTDNSGKTTPTEAPVDEVGPTEEPVKSSTNSGSTKDVLPDTGEASNSAQTAGFLAVFGGMALLVGRKRKQEDVQTEDK
ncbi:Ig-like domain-containing protein [Macrococcus sp. DPC7161]|uniref:Ig-like domain-containing protein n=1 Tax=Macrococcus sp. DPC7161 TaxID=2507060 RepID=UPI00100C17D7|nr:Ig-like domain-containing protein [Macrococcus sp. DPC7161]RXK17179.1 YSIRK-type signal peptide-containing protein [Macrococcus sp. DPC7161]